MNLIHKLFNFFNIKLSMIFFKNFNLYTYNLFNFFYRLFISDKNVPQLQQFIKNGYQKLTAIDVNKIKKINEQLDINNTKHIVDGSLSYNITPEAFNLIIDILESDLKSTIINLEKYYNAKVILSGVNASRNQNIDSSKETYSNYLHNDGYLFTTIQIFINLMDIEKDNGPLEFIDSKKQKELIKKLSLLNIQRRFFSKNYFKEDELKENIGKIGDALLFNTSDYLHGAGIPKKNKPRDILFLRLSMIPKSVNLQKEMKIDTNAINSFHTQNNLHKLISKPENISQISSLFVKYYKSRNIN